MSTESTIAAGLAPVPGVPKPDPLLSMDALQRRFGGVLSVDVNHLEFQRRFITGVIGPNGAGKTTLFNLLTGFDRPDHGTYRLRDRDLTGQPPHRIARAGVVRTFQLTKSMAKLPVIENVKLAAQQQRGENLFLAPFSRAWRAQERSVEDRAAALLERFNLGHMRDAYAGTLSGGQRKLLEVARALMSEPEVLMLDEPMAGVNPALSQTIMGHLRDLAHEDMTVVFVEHDMDMVMGISDWVVCLAQGRVIAEGPPASMADNDEVVEAYLGAGFGARAAKSNPTAQPDQATDGDHGQTTGSGQ